MGKSKGRANHRVTLGIPLALRQAADLWADGVPLAALTEGVPDYAPREALVRLMCERVLVHVEPGPTGDPGPRSLRNLVVSLLISRLFARAQPVVSVAEPSPPPRSRGGPRGGGGGFLLLDEAHNFTASGALAAKPLTRWAREGRNFGLSIALATQRPATLPADIISQADILIIHHLTLLDDLKAVGRLASTYARNLPAILKGIREPGQAVIIDDATERAVVGHILPTP